MLRYEFKITLKEVIKKRRISVRKLAEESGISKSEIYYICSGQKKPTLETMLMIAAVLRVDLKELYEFKIVSTLVDKV